MMLNHEDFELPLEKQLRMRVISQEIDECTDVDALRENLKTCAESLMRFQHLCSRMAEQQLKGFMNEFLDTISVEMSNETDA
jgi:5,10-methylene-tetrahydrofolate dehydrogenase/methenyl tetrahydrofolate cyclohydrolase